MTAFSASDHAHMAHALQLAARGLYTTSPNPRVGCVIVRDGQVVGEGWHERAGGPHAEVHALRQAGEAARGATAYVTLEPCSHYGRTPPCAEALVKAGVTRVIAAMQDPNPLVAGKGLLLLQSQGIAVASGLMRGEARELNVGFVSRMERNRPWVRAKVAASLDGRTALENGVSQWITSPAARRDGQQWRARACAILTGMGTVLADNPRLNVRDFDIGRQPLRVVVDSKLRMPPDAAILEGGVLIACADDTLPQAEVLRKAGAELLCLPNQNQGIDLPLLMSELAKRGVNELHVEAGPTLTGELLRLRLIDEFLLYLAPTLLGSSSRGMFDIPALTAMDQRMDLDLVEVRHVGPDIRILARPR
jgi:diaminohydroxyphosphoribosylaminopyrimidine deaminase/5-amino-6-(5-phosphoribosylamino)uracil reductase